MYGYLSKFRQLLLKVDVAPAAPVADVIVLYAKTGGIICHKNSAGVETVLATAADIAALIDAAPGVLDTLNELAAALGDDANYAATVTAALALKASIVQVQNDTIKSAVAAGTADAITATLAPVPTLTDMMRVYIRASGANTVVAPTLNLNALGALTIYKHGGLALVAADIKGAGHELELVYRASPARWELLNPAVSGGGGTAASTTIADAGNYYTGTDVEAALQEIGAGGGGGGGGEASGIVQIVSTPSTATGSTTSVIPVDNTTPQNTEGAAFAGLDTTITPISASTRLRARVRLPLISGSGAIDFVAALFKDSDVDAVASRIETITGNNYHHELVMDFDLGVTGSTTARTYKLRFGPHNGAFTAYINRTSGTAAYFNGTLQAFMEIEEYDPVGSVSTGTLPVGAQIGYKSTPATATDTTAVLIPLDNTIPQVTEGKEYSALTTTYTPKRADSTLRIRVHVPLMSISTLGTPQIALFRDGAANAIASGIGTTQAADYAAPASLYVEVPANATTLTTFTVRFGGTGGTTAILGAPGSFHSTVDAAYLTIEEVSTVGVALGTAGGGYPYIYEAAPFANVIAQLHFESGLTDSTGFNTWTASGTAAVSGAQFEYGTQSLLVPGSGNSGIRTSQANSRWDFGSGDFSFEFSGRYNGAPETFARFFQSSNGDVAAGMSITTDGSSSFVVSIGSVSSWTPFVIPQTGWHRVILCRKGNTLYAALDGNPPVSTTITGAVTYNSGYEFIIGGQSTGVSRSTNFYFDEWRITKGFSVLRPNLAYSAPTAAFPDS